MDVALMSSNSVSALDACIANLTHRYPAIAFAEVPTGICSFWGERLGWPAWLGEGTSFAEAREPPPRIRLVDDLRIASALIKRVGEAELVKMIFEWDRFPGDVALLAAPDLAAAVGFFSETVDRANPPLNVALDEKSDPTRISISIDEKIAPFRALYEQVTVAVLFRVLRSYLSHREGSIEDLRQIEIGLASSTETIARCVPCQVGEAQGEAFISIPQDTLAAANCNFSPELWGVLSARNVRFRERRGGGGARRGHDAVKSTEAALIISLSDYSRVPRFTEVALSLNCSERTLARDLAKAGTSYRALVDRVRMDMARDFLLRGKLSVTEVAMRLGYGDATAFVRSFKRHFGTSPARWCRREALESLKGSIAV